MNAEQRARHNEALYKHLEAEFTLRGLLTHQMSHARRQKLRYALLACSHKVERLKLTTEGR